MPFGFACRHERDVVESGRCGVERARHDVGRTVDLGRHAAGQGAAGGVAQNTLTPINNTTQSGTGNQAPAVALDELGGTVNQIDYVYYVANSGTFTLSFDGQTTVALPFNAGTGQVQAALEALPAIGQGNVIVSGVAGGFALAAGYYVQFENALGGVDETVNPLNIDFGLSMFLVPERRYRKIDPQDPVGDFQVSGSIFVAGVALRYNFE